MAKRTMTDRARAFGEKVLDDNDVTEQIPEPAAPTVAEERRKVVRIARHQYAAQLLPWKVAIAATAAGVFVTVQHWSPWGALPWMFVLGVASFLFTEWRLGGRHIKTGRVDWGNPRGRKQRRIRQRAFRSGIMGLCAGAWLIAVTIAAGSHGASLLVWLAGAAVWATLSATGWWIPAAQDQAAPPIHDEADDGFVVDVPAAAAAPAAGPATRPRPGSRPRGGVPIPDGPVTSAPTEPAAAVTEPVQAPSVSVLNTTVDPSALTPLEDLSASIQGVLDQHGLDARVVEAVRAPAVTRYGIRPNPGQQVDAILRRRRDFALACGTDRIMVRAPIEGRPLVGIEVPNKDRSWVTLGEVLASAEAQRDPHPLLIALGKNHDGDYLISHLHKMPHVLFGGETGGGKSGGIDAVIMSIITRATPDEVQFLMIDVKRVELTRYQGIPHLVMPVITKADKAGDALQWVVAEVERRYAEMERAGVKHIDQLNEMIINGTHKAPPGARYTMRPFPYLAIVIDELADLMMVDEEGAVEEAIIRIGQIARAAGVHLVLATQNPVVKVVTGRIKANVPSRIAYRTANGVDSKVILDEVGAEKLLGKGDSIVKLSGSHSTRVQGCLTTEAEVAAVVEYWRDQADKRGLIVPDIDLESVARTETPAQGKPTAYDQVLAAAKRHADRDRRVTKDQIRAATPQVTESARNAALTRLFDAGELLKVEGQQAVFIVPLHPQEEKPLTQEDEDKQ